MTSSAFSINSTSVPQSTGLAVSTTYGATATLTLDSTVGASTISWSIVGVSGPAIATPTITPSGTPLGSTATFTIGSDQSDGLGVAYGVRCRVTDSARTVYDAYGIVGVPNNAGDVPFVAGEAYNWRHPTQGWCPQVNIIAARQRLMELAVVDVTGSPGNTALSADTWAEITGTSFALGSATESSWTLAGSGAGVVWGGSGTVLVLVNAQVSAYCSVSDDIQHVGVAVDGSIVGTTGSQLTGTRSCCSVHQLVEVASGETVSIRVKTTDGGDLTVQGLTATFAAITST